MLLSKKENLNLYALSWSRMTNHTMADNALAGMGQAGV